MSRLIALPLILTACTILQGSRDAMQLPGREGTGGKTEASPVTIALTKLDVNDQTLELRYAIRNGSDHDVWVCDGLGLSDVPGSKSHEVYLDRDQRTLVIRKRIEVPLETESSIIRDFEGRFVRVRPGQQRGDSLSLAVPVRPHLVVGGGGSFPGRVTRLALEIGFYDGDLPGTMRIICEMADKLKSADLGNPGFKTLEVLWPRFPRKPFGALIGSARGRKHLKNRPPLSNDS